MAGDVTTKQLPWGLVALVRRVGLEALRALLLLLSVINAVHRIEIVRAGVYLVGSEYNLGSFTGQETRKERKLDRKERGN